MPPRATKRTGGSISAAAVLLAVSCAVGSLSHYVFTVANGYTLLTSRPRAVQAHGNAGTAPKHSSTPVQGCGAFPAALAGVFTSAAVTAAAQARRSPSAIPMQARGGESSVVQKFFGTVPDWSVGIHGVVITLLRVTTAVMMIHHGNEGGFWPASSPEALKGFTDFIVKPYLGWLPFFDSTTWAVIHDYVEFWGAILLLFGLFTRVASLALFSTMCLAVYFHLASTGLQGFPLGHVENYSYNFEEPALYAMIFLTFAINGPGPFAVDTALKPKD